jgi:hypothetical protein
MGKYQLLFRGKRANLYYDVCGRFALAIKNGEPTGIILSSVAARMTLEDIIAADPRAAANLTSAGVRFITKSGEAKA